VDELRRHLRQILGLTKEHNIAVVGAGNLGLALASYGGFNVNGFHLVAIFDSDPEKVGMETRAGLIIQDTATLGEVIQREKIDIIVITVPANAAEQVLEDATAAGVKAVLNFAPIRLHAKPGVKVKHVDLSVSLESLSYFLERGGAATESAAVGADFRDFLPQDAHPRNGKRRKVE
jgi:redox-sensing transcriptional repressor